MTIEEERKADIDIIEELAVKTSYPIGESIGKFFHKTRKKAENFVRNQIPAARDDFTSWITSFRGGIILLCLVLVIVLPVLIDSGDWYHAFILAMIYGIFAASWDLLAGVTGQVSFGHAAFFGIGGYACAAFLFYLNLNIFLTILLGGIFAVLIGLIVSVPSLRLKGPYLALGTLAFSLFLWILFRMDTLEYIFWGTDGIDLGTSNPVLFMGLENEFFLVLLIMIISVVIMLAVYNSKLGTIFKGIRDDEVSTEASGINVLKYKLIAFMISAFFAGIAGSLYVLHNNQADPFIFMPTKSFYPVVMTCLGGIAMISGAVFGAYFFTIATIILENVFSAILPPELLLVFTNISVFIFSIIILLVVRFTDRGLMTPAIEQSKNLWDLLLGK
jgi:branched-chain amino acid transport system permease protein